LILWEFVKQLVIVLVVVLLLASLDVKGVTIGAIVASIVCILSEKSPTEVRFLMKLLGLLHLLLGVTTPEVWVDRIEDVRQLLQVVEVRDVTQGL